MERWVGVELIWQTGPRSATFQVISGIQGGNGKSGGLGEWMEAAGGQCTWLFGERGQKSRGSQALVSLLLLKAVSFKFLFCVRFRAQALKGRAGEDLRKA